MELETQLILIYFTVGNFFMQEDINDLDFSKSLWMLTSSEAVRYLGRVMQDQFTQSLSIASALCPHHNIADAAQEIGFGEVFTTEPGDEALIKASLAWLTL